MRKSPVPGPSHREGLTLVPAGDPGANEHTQRAAAHRHRAEELRSIAPGLMNETSREIFFRLAENYDQLAQIQDQLAALKS